MPTRRDHRRDGTPCRSPIVLPSGYCRAHQEQADHGSTLCFRIDYLAKDLELDLRDSEAVEFRYDDGHPVTVLLRSATPQELKKYDVRYGSPYCVAQCRRVPSPPIGRVFEYLEQNRVPPECGQAIEHSEHFSDTQYADTEGRFEQSRMPPLRFWPQPFQSFAEQVQSELSDCARRTITTLRWRTDALGPSRPLVGDEFQWSRNGETWKLMPVSHLEVYVSHHLLPRIPRSLRDEILELATSDMTEPLGHDLLREAQGQMHGNPRAALVLAIAAVETHVKNCIATLVPDAKWLVSEVQSPPVVRMLKDYLPRLPAKCTIQDRVRPPPQDLMELLKKGVQIRNSIVHGKTYTLKHATLREVLLTVRDVLWLLDYYRGFKWALAYLREETLEMLKQ